MELDIDKKVWVKGFANNISPERGIIIDYDPNNPPEYKVRFEFKNIVQWYNAEDLIPISDNEKMYDDFQQKIEDRLNV